jgi:P-type conjugative transfer protein TrbJ
MRSHHTKAGFTAVELLASAHAVEASGAFGAAHITLPESTLRPAQFATEVTQLLNNAQLVQMGGEQIRQGTQLATQITNQLQQIENQLKMYQNMLQNTASLPQRIWDQAQQNIQQLAQLAQTGQGLAYSMSNVDSVFRQRFSS